MRLSFKMKLTPLFVVAALFSPCARADNLYVEPEIGIFIGRYRQIQDRAIGGVQAGVGLGYQWATHQAGIEFHARYFESDAPGSLSYLTNIPIGLGLRTKIADGCRLLLAWHWDDVLYREFFLKYQGLKIPKDYDLAQEGPGSWKIGLSRAMSGNIHLNATIWIQSYESYKRRHPVEVIGPVDPVLHMLSFATTLSFML